ncbi:MAG: ABC transporter ATP-binding protein [bacterium]|nr:ABC transporter ATP-binding protein [bacterium]
MSEVLIQFEQVVKSFGYLRVLDGVDLQVRAGESICVIGLSGSGKSVMLKHLIRLIEPDSGRILFEGNDIGQFDSDELVTMRRRFGMLFQGAALLDSMTVAENVGLGLLESRQFTPEQIDEIVNEKLEMVGMSATKGKLPAELSGGMRKRIGLARAIATNPDVMLYDEPTSGLDPVTSDVIDDLIVELNQKLHVTSITVTHDMRSAFKIADRIVMLYHGKVEFDGTPDQVRNTPNPILQQFISGSAQGPIRVA